MQKTKNSKNNNLIFAVFLMALVALIYLATGGGGLAPKPVPTSTPTPNAVIGAMFHEVNASPNAFSAIVRTFTPGESMPVIAIVEGHELDKNNSTWFQVEGGFVYSGFVATPTPQK